MCTHARMQQCTHSRNNARMHSVARRQHGRMQHAASTVHASHTTPHPTCHDTGCTLEALQRQAERVNNTLLGIDDMHTNLDTARGRDLVHVVFDTNRNNRTVTRGTSTMRCTLLFATNNVNANITNLATITRMLNIELKKGCGSATAWHDFNKDGVGRHARGCLPAAMEHIKAYQSEFSKVNTCCCVWGGRGVRCYICVCCMCKCCGACACACV